MATSTFYLIVDLFLLLRLASPTSGRVRNIIYEWMFS
jgi:hypothetical protein